MLSGCALSIAGPQVLGLRLEAVVEAERKSCCMTVLLFLEPCWFELWLRCCKVYICHICTREEEEEGAPVSLAAASSSVRLALLC